MSDVKLFRVTEFAQSTFPSPLAHRNSIHPLWMMLIAAVWVATAGHWPLWQLFMQSGSQASPALMAYFGLQWVAGSLLLMAVACWRWTFKPAVTLLLFWAALGACQMVVLADAGQAIGVTPRTLMAFVAKPDNWRLMWNWKCLVTLLLVAVVPVAMMAAGKVRRIPFNQNFTLNALLLVASYGLLVWTRSQIGHSMPSVIDPLALF
jgi:glucan phosphoethanolaminetransferase (alkaline phosphatase superfamily)